MFLKQLKNKGGSGNTKTTTAMKIIKNKIKTLKYMLISIQLQINYCQKEFKKKTSNQKELNQPVLYLLKEWVQISTFHN